jgi:acylphosphatase
VTATITVQVRIEGRVQGVWYRGWTVDEANARGLNGWVRNRRDGSVEAIFRGPEHAVRDMVQLCAKGPPAAHVTNVIDAPSATELEDGFRQLPTE